MIRLHTILLASALCAGAILVASVSEAAEVTSPYLRMHAADPIRWAPWDDAALARARRENKPILLSVGYASCHWCLTMAERTFRDPAVAEAVNRFFVPILVDREERPDLDAWFMQLKLAMDGIGGWPLNMVLTPDLTPLYAANYLPPRPERGQLGLLMIASELGAAWARGDRQLLADAATVRAQIAELAAPAPGTSVSGDPREAATRPWRDRFDGEHGGFGRGAKFPEPAALMLLLQEGARHRDGALMDRVFLTLDRMAAGGIRDQLGGLFHRYAADRQWQVPHFEITLDVNANLARLYLAAYQADGQDRYRRVAEGILDGLLARMRLADGGFATALAADDPAGEGRFYTWSEAEVRTLLGNRADAFLGAYHVDGALRLRQDRADPARLGAARQILRKARALRPQPARDDKMLASWNAMAASAFAEAGRILDRRDYLATARATVRQLLTDGRVPGHSRMGGRWTSQLFLEDVAFTAAALIDLYEAEFDERDLTQAASLAKQMLARFQPAPSAPLYLVPMGTTSAIPRLTVIEEDNGPSGQAAALTVLRRLAAYGIGGDIAREADAIAATLAAKHGRLPPGLASAWQFHNDDSREIVIVGPANDAATTALLREVDRRLLPGAVVARPAADASSLDWPNLRARPLVEGQPTAYVCSKGVCGLPVTEPAALADQLGGR